VRGFRCFDSCVYPESCPNSPSLWRLGFRHNLSEALEDACCQLNEKIYFAGLVVTASFTDIPHLTATYWIVGFILVLFLEARVLIAFGVFTKRLQSTWDNLQRLGEFIATADRYQVTFLHAEDDRDIQMKHSVQLFREAVWVVDAKPKGQAKNPAVAANGDDRELDDRIDDKAENA
jgi:hypothetical protein